MRELVENDRVIGGLRAESTQAVTKFYEMFVKGNLYQTDARTAEMTKLAENSFRDVNIAYANELSMICDELGISTHELVSLANRHPRVNILKPGPGVGGHCIAVDPWFIVASAPERAKLIRQAREVNTYKTEWTIEKIKNAVYAFKEIHKKAPKVCLFGMSFKPDVDDLRESPALQICKKIASFHEETFVVEPNVRTHDSLSLIPTAKALTCADIAVFLVAHKSFKGLQFEDDVKILDFCGSTIGQ
jgi:UDP-N-acetyl-D-mannosaminuronic acid dehydrogenase